MILSSTCACYAVCVAMLHDFTDAVSVQSLGARALMLFYYLILYLYGHLLPVHSCIVLLSVFATCFCVFSLCFFFSHKPPTSAGSADENESVWLNLAHGPTSALVN